jgi:LAO/AO transport system kinase
MQASGEWHQKRSGQQVAWMWDMLQQRMMEALTSNTRTADRLKSLEEEVRGGKTAVSLAVDELATLMGLGE